MFNPHLVGGFNHLEKYESQWEGLSHIFWKIKAMFETTNQPLIPMDSMSLIRQLMLNSP